MPATHGFCGACPRGAWSITITKHNGSIDMVRGCLHHVDIIIAAYQTIRPSVLRIGVRLLDTTAAEVSGAMYLPRRG